MGEYTVFYQSFDEVKYCGECNTQHPVGYEFMCLKCACGCDDVFLICLICLPMYMKCECGSNGCYGGCNQRPTMGKLKVIFFFFFNKKIYFLFILLLFCVFF